MGCNLIRPLALLFRMCNTQVMTTRQTPRSYLHKRNPEVITIRAAEFHFKRLGIHVTSFNGGGEVFGYRDGIAYVVTPNGSSPWRPGQPVGSTVFAHDPQDTSPAAIYRNPIGRLANLADLEQLDEVWA